ncbi:MAG: ABC transporter transmembrane domain-containing protein, partial [Deltaproteobacteria bacterium]|nr:ABC transporter transmembrane domain-containing protein [Deltaproteobacteria bacterium]
MSVITKILKLLLRHKLQLFFGFMFMAAYSLFTVAPAWYMKPIVDSLSSGNIPQLKKFIMVGFGIILLFIFKGISYFGQNFLMSTLGQKLILELREKLYNKIILMPFGFFNKRSTGDIISRFTTDLNTLNEALYASITGPLRDIPQLFMLLGIMLTRSWQLFLVTFFLLPPAAWLITIFGNKNKKVTQKRLNKYGELTTLLTETITGIRVVKAFSMEKYELNRFQKENKRLYN